MNLRGLLRLFAVLSALSAAAFAQVAAQGLSIIHIHVVLTGADGVPRPVPRHALLVSDDPATAAPRRIVTAADGTAQVHVRPGSYIIESERPIQYQGKAYEW